MPSFRYKGVSLAGKRVSGLIEAESARGARAQLRERGVLASDLKQSESDRSLFNHPLTLFSRRISPRVLSRAMRQLATLLRAGVPLVEAVASIRKRGVEARLGAALDNIRVRLLEGESFAAGLARHPSVFPAIYVAMVEAGEASGALDSVCERIADHAEASARLQSRARAAMTYPAIMSLVGGGIVLFLLAYVVPQVTRVFAEANQQLPLPTRMLMAAGSAVGNYGAVMFLGLLALLAGIRVAVSRDEGRRRFESLLLATPVAGGLFRDLAVARFAQTLSTMVSGGLTLVDALRISRSASGSLLVNDALARAETAVSEGESLAEHLEGNPLFHPMIVDMLAVGERSGDLEGMLAKAAEALDEEVGEQIDTLARLAEPAMIVLMAGVVLFVLLAIMLPVFEMNQLVR